MFTHHIFSRLIIKACLRVLAVGLTVSPAAALAQSFDQLTLPVASIHRPALIDTFLLELLIPPPDTVARVDIVDMTRNGFGPDDVVILYPTEVAYPIRSDVPRRLQNIMKVWELTADYRLDATLQESYTLQREADRRQDARGAISSAVVRAIADYYDGTDIDLRLERGADGLRLEMWNYDPDALKYRAQVSRAICQPTTAQQFRFAQPQFVVTFAEAAECVEARRSNGKVTTHVCDSGQ